MRRVAVRAPPVSRPHERRSAVGMRPLSSRSESGRKQGSISAKTHSRRLESLLARNVSPRQSGTKNVAVMARASRAPPTHPKTSAAIGDARSSAPSAICEAVAVEYSHSTQPSAARHQTHKTAAARRAFRNAPERRLMRADGATPMPLRSAAVAALRLRRSLRSPVARDR